MEHEFDAALLSVHDRRGIVELAQALVARNIRLYATGGTRAYLAEHDIECEDVGQLTGYPALFDGRVKTLHPTVFGGILADRNNADHLRQAKEHGIPRIALVAVNLYPFEATITRENVTLLKPLSRLMSAEWPSCAQQRKIMNTSRF